MTAFMEAVCRKDENGQWAFDILLMDICLPDGDGIESARVLRQKGFQSVIIFQSSSAEYAMDAFSVSALQYLVKPVCREHMDRTIERAIEEIQHKPVQERKEETNGQGG